MIKRVAKPSDDHGGAPGAPTSPGGPGAAAPLPKDEELTNWLSLAGHGARRQLVVPCGFELDGRAENVAKVDLLIKYSAAACETP